jgi:hypothetical protein
MTSVKFQMLLVTGTYTGDADEYKGCYFAPYKVTVLINIPPFYTVMNIAQDATPIIQ